MSFRLHLYVDVIFSTSLCNLRVSSTRIARILLCKRTIRTCRVIKKHLSINRRFCEFRGIFAQKSIRFLFELLSSQRHNGVFERHTSIIVYCQIVWMWILHYQRGRYHNNETRHILFTFVRVSVCVSLHSKLLYAPNG